MQTLTATGLTKAYGDKQLFDQIDFLINEGDRIGLIGVNGTGKTTLIRGLAGLDSIDGGTIKTPKDYRVGYLAQTPDLDPKLTVMDAIFQGDSPVFRVIRQYERALKAYTEDPMNDALNAAYSKADAAMTQEDAWSAETEIKTILSQLHLAQLDQTVGELSGGQQKRVGLAQALIESPDLLLLDEPTNHLDFDSITWLEHYLAAYRGALVVVTHDRYFLDRVSNKIFELDRGRLFQYPGNYQAYLSQKAIQLEQEQTSQHKAAQLYRQELTWMRAGAQARSTKQQARINRFNALADQRDAQPGAQAQMDEIEVATTRLGKKVIEIDDAYLAFEQQVILDDFSWLVQPGQRIGITGQNGAGKSTLLNVIAGQQPLDRGTISLGETVKLGYYTQLNTQLDDSMRVINYLQQVGESVIQSDGVPVSVAAMLERFLFPRETHGTLIGRLSGGEKRRLYLLQILMQQPNVLLLDEPTNDLDIATLTVLEDYLARFPGTVITVSHDRYFLDKVANQLLFFQGNGQIDRHVGSLSAYLDTAEPEATPQKTKPATPVTSTVEAKPKTKLTYNEKIEYEQLQQDLDELDTQLAQVKADMATTPGEDYVALGALQSQIDQINATIDEKFERFAELDQYA